MASSPAYPFTGYVVNLNVVTDAHRDFKDKTICIVLALGQFQGGQLVLYEPGLVVDLRSGDWVAFPSGDTTHFNLHYKGKRASIVLHSDKEGDQWVKTRRGWESNKWANFGIHTIVPCEESLE